MVNVTMSQARGLVAPMTGQVRVTHQDGMTSQIIAEVLDVSAESAGQTARLAEALKGATPLESCQNVFRFVRKNVRYKLDPNGKQFIKSPAAVIGTGFCDCKGYATTINDLLRCLGIRCAFRFVSFTASTSVTHVYTVAWPTPGGPLVVLDACLPRFNQQKPYTHHEDHMTQISRVSGIAPAGSANPYLSVSGLESPEEMSIKLMREGALIERDQAVRVQGIGSVSAGEHQAAVNDYNAALRAMSSGPVAIAGFHEKLTGRLAKLRTQRRERKAGNRLNPSARPQNTPAWLRRVMPQQVSGPAFRAPRADREERRIGFLKKLFNKAKSAVKSVTKTVAKTVAKAATATGKAVAKGVKVVAKTAVKAGKFALKVVTLPVRLLAKGLLEIFLPKMAPMFLYLFITNQGTIASLPAAAARKRRKAVKFAHFITNTVGMKEAHFMKAVRNGIQKQMGGTPEQILAKTVKGPISGIGLLPLAALAPLAMKAGPVIMQVIEKIMSVFGKKPAADETLTTDDAPDPAADFADATPKTVRKVVTHITQKPASQRGEEPDTYANEMAQEAEENAAQLAVDNEPDDTPVDAPLPEPADYPDDAPADYADEAGPDELAPDEELADEPEEVSGISQHVL